METRRSYQKVLQAAKCANPSGVSTVSNGNGSWGKGKSEGVRDTLALPFGVLGREKKWGRGRPRKNNEIGNETNKSKRVVEKIKEIGISACPQCQVEFDGVRCSPIQEACGHVKCRACFIQSLGKGDNYCQQCELKNGIKIDKKRTVENEQTEHIEKSSVKATECTKEITPIVRNFDGVSNKQHSIQNGMNFLQQSQGEMSQAAAPESTTNTQEPSLVRENILINRFQGAELVENELENNLSSTEDDVSAAVSNKASENFIKRNSLKVTLQIQSKDERGNASRARVKIPNAIEKKRKRHPINCPDHIIKVQRYNEDPVRYKCTVCNKSFKTKAHIKYHKYCSVDGNASIEKPFQCDQCDNSFVTKSHFEYHRRTHTGERPYECSICGKRFNQRGKVTRHMRSHTGEKPFICQQCGRGYATAQALRAHFLIHTGERPFACQYCNKRFTGLTNLRKHTIIHTGDRPFSCSHCHKSFGLKWTRDLHLKTHSTDRPFECNECPRGFLYKKDLLRHSLIHSGERPFKCMICGTGFRRKDNLSRHAINLHNEVRKIISTVKQPSKQLLDTIESQSSQIKMRGVKEYTVKNIAYAATTAVKITEARDKDTTETPNITACKVILPDDTRESEGLSSSPHSQLEEQVTACNNNVIASPLELQIKREVCEAESIVEDLVRAGLRSTTESKNISRPDPESDVIQEIFIKQEQIDTDVDSESSLCTSKPTVTLVVEEDGSTHVVL